MSIWNKFTGGLRALLHKHDAEHDMDDELRAFLDASAERKMRSGMPEAEARRAARVEKRRPSDITKIGRAHV